MATPTTDAERPTPAAYPMVDEDDATGRVAGVYGAILDRFPMVPSLFKSLAVCPGYLELAWAQTDAALDLEAFTSAAGRLADEAAEEVPPPQDAAIREVVGRFVGPLARMLLVTAGLRAALDGTVTGAAATPAELTHAGEVAPDLRVPSTGEMDPGLVGRIRRDLGTPIVNSVWRVAAAEGLLSAGWDHFGALIAEDTFASRARRVADDAVASAAAIAWPVVASPAALERAQVADAAAGAAAILDGYLATLPTVLTLVASSRD